MILAPVHWHPRSIGLGGRGVVASDQVERFLVRPEQNRMNPMIAPRRHAAQFLHLIQPVVPIRIRHAIQAALHLALVIVHPHIQRTKRPQQPIRRADLGRHLFNILRLQHIPCCRRLEPVQPPKLITDNDASLVIGTKVYPRSLNRLRHRIQQLHLEAVGHFDIPNRRGRILHRLSLSKDAQREYNERNKKT